MGNIPKPYYFVLDCPDTGRQFLVEHKKDGNIIEFTSENIAAMRKIGSQEKTYIFLTIDGTTLDGSGEDVENCQMLAIAKGEDVLTAYNNMLSARSWAGHFDTCFAYELMSENMSCFDLCNDEDDDESDKKCPDCGTSLCEEESDKSRFCVDCGYDESDNVYHCIKCEKAIGFSDYKIGDGKCADCQ